MNRQRWHGISVGATKSKYLKWSAYSGMKIFTHLAADPNYIHNLISLGMLTSTTDGRGAWGPEFSYMRQLSILFY